VGAGGDHCGAGPALTIVTRWCGGSQRRGCRQRNDGRSMVRPLLPFDRLHHDPDVQDAVVEQDFPLFSARDVSRHSQDSASRTRSRSGCSRLLPPGRWFLF
jgi:hypothetical protein